MWKKSQLFKFFGLLLFFALAGPPLARGQSVAGQDFTQNIFQKPIPLGFGGAFRAVADTTAAIIYNPAGLTQLRGKVAAGGDYMYSGMNKSNAFSVAVADYKATDAVAMGLEYDRDVFSLGNTVTVNMITLALATELGEMFSFGGSAKGYFSSVDSPLAEGPDGADMDLGLLFKPIPMLSLAATAHNLIRGHTVEEFPFQLGFGAALVLEPHARLAVDVLKDFKSVGSSGAMNAYFGGEGRITEGVFLRGGFGLDQIRDNNYYSVGMGTSGPKISAGFTFAQRLNPTYESYTGNVEVFF